MKKLRNRKGETIVESLCAILIVAVVFAFLSQAIAAAARSNRQVADADRSFSYADMPAKTGTVQIAVFSGWKVGTATDAYYYDVDEYVTRRGEENPDAYIYRRYQFGGGGT